MNGRVYLTILCPLMPNWCAPRFKKIQDAVIEFPEHFRTELTHVFIFDVVNLDYTQYSPIKLITKIRRVTYVGRGMAFPFGFSPYVNIAYM